MPLTVLIIDDDVDSAEMLAALIETAGHRALVAFNGATGIEVARRHRPGVVICDIGMSGMTGYDVARAVRSDPDLGGVTLIALTGYGTMKDLKRAAAAGFDRHIMKPADLDGLLELLEDFGPAALDPG